MIFVTLLYIALLIVFFAISGVIILHAAKLGPLVPKFRWIVGIFALLAVVVVIFSIVLLIGLSGDAPTRVPTPSGSSSGNLNF